MSAEIQQVRRFNRLVTQRAGVLTDQFLGLNRPLGESRVLYEIGRRGADLRTLRARLGLDSGYLTRLVQSLESRDLIRVEPTPRDRRVRRARLTALGGRELRMMNRRSDRAAAALLAPLSDRQRTSLITAMSEVERILRAAGVVIERRDPSTPEARWCVQQYFTELTERFKRRFDPAASLPADDGDLRPPKGAFLLATIDGETVACGAVKATTARIGSIKRMWVARSARGLGLGRSMLAGLETEARALGLSRLRLETNRSLLEAIALYRSSGYREVSAFNDDPYADYWFEKRLR